MKILEFICPITNIKISIKEDGTILDKYGRKITKHLDKDGYHYISLKAAPNRKNYKVHRLVATSFIDNPDNKPDVNHKDGVKINNAKINLQWVTKSENMKHAVALKLCTNSSQKGEKHNTSKISFENVKQLRKDYKENKGSMRKLAKDYNISVGLVSDIINNKCRIEC